MQIPALELAFNVRLDFTEGPRVRFTPAHTRFTRGFVGLAGGMVSGPLLAGHVVPGSGGDWPRFWDSGLVEFEAHYMLEATDGTPIYIRNTGVAYSTPEVVRRIEAGESVAPEDTYLRITPRFEAPDGPHGWLTRTMFVGVAQRRGNSTFFDYYRVT